MFILDNISNILKNAVELVNSTSEENLNKIPGGFNNNIAWNFGHIVVTGYSLVFKATKVDPAYPIPYAAKFTKGTKPEEPVSREEIDELIKMADAYIPTLRDALDNEAFASMSAYKTDTFGVPVSNIDEMLITVAMHDTLHWQNMKDYKRMLEQ